MGVGHERGADRPGAGLLTAGRAWCAARAGLLLAAAACGGDADGGRVAVASGFTDEVLLFDARDGTPLGSVTVDPRPGERDEPHALARAPDGRHWYVSVSHGVPSLHVFETATGRRVGRLDLPARGAGRIGVSPDGRTALVPDYWRAGGGATSGAVLVRLADLAVLDTLALCAAPHDAVWSPDGASVAVTCPLGDEVLLLDGVSLDVRARVPLPEPGGRSRPMNAAWSPDGRRVWVTLMGSGEVAVLDALGERVDRSPVGAEPAQLAIVPGGERVVVALRGETAVAIVHTASGRVETLDLGDAPHPHGLALTPDGRRAFVTWEGTTDRPGGVAAIDLARAEVVWSREAGVFTLGVVWLPPAG